MSSDVIIVGGAAMGSSTAYHLLVRDPSLSVTVVERDSSYARASTVLSDGNVRVQFNLEENIRISQHTLDVIRTFPHDMATPHHQPEVSARHQGNLFMVDRAGVDPALEGLRLQRELDCDVEWLDVERISSRYPEYSATGLAGGTLGHDDGSVDPSAVLHGYRLKAIDLGARYLEAEVESILADGNTVRGVWLTDEGEMRSEVVVNAAGAWSTTLAASVGVDLPVEPVMRTVYVVSTSFSTAGLPSVFLPSGLYAIPEGGHSWLIGWSRPEDPVGFDFRPASRERFVELLWPALVEHLPAFDSLRIESSWAGLYAVNRLDGNAIVGQWPHLRGLYLATGFSGHGFQQCPAVGRYLAESILGLPHELDLHRLGPQRVIDRRPLPEHAGRII